MRQIEIRRILIALTVLLAVGMTAVWAPVALAAVAPGTYEATFSNAHPASAHVANDSPEPQCVVQNNLDVICNSYTLGGVGGTNASVSLVASYSETIDCTNKGGNLVESHTVEGFTDSDPATARVHRSGQIEVGTLLARAFSAPQVVL